MARISSCFLAFLNVLSLLLSIILIGGSVLLRYNATSECERLVHLPFLIVGAFLFVTSLAGLIGSCCGVTFFSALYSILLFVLMMGLTAFTIFSFIVTNKQAGDLLSGRRIKDYKLGDYSNWLQKRVSDGDNWNKIKSCLNEAEICRSLGQDVDPRASNFLRTNLSPIQSGCCKPPIYCGFAYKNATFWEIPKQGPLVPDEDCKSWSNDQKNLCYDCKSCRIGFLSNIRKGWMKIIIVNIIVLFIVDLAFILGRVVCINNRCDKHYKKYHPSYH